MKKLHVCMYVFCFLILEAKRAKENFNLRSKESTESSFYAGSLLMVWIGGACCSSYLQHVGI